MADVRDPAEENPTSGSQPAGGDLTLRVDKLFAGAIEEQLSEQRALNTLMTRVDTGLEQLRADLAELAKRAQPGRDEETVQALGAVERRSVELMEAVPARLSELQSTLIHALAVRDDVDRLGTAGMLRRLEELRAEIAEAVSARDTQAATAIQESITTLQSEASQLGAMREALSERTNDAVRQLSELVDTTAARQREALATIESATARIETVQHETRDRLSEVMAGAMTDLRAASEHAAAAQMRTLSDSAAGVLAALQETTASVGAGFNDRIVAAGTGIKEVVDQVREALLVTAEEDREQMRAALTDLRASAKQIAGELQASLTQTDVARTASAADLSSLSKSVRGLQSEVETLVSRLEQATNDHVAAAASVASDVLSRTKVLDETTAALARATASIEPALAETAGEVLTALRQTAKEDRAQMRDGIARIQQSAERMGQGLEESLKRHIDDIHAESAAELAGVNQSLAAARRALEDTAESLAGVVAEQVRGSGAATGAQVAELQVSVDDLRSLLERTVREMNSSVAEAVERVDAMLDEQALAATLSMVSGAGYADDDE